MKRKTIVLGLLFLSCSCTTTYRIERYDLNKKYVTEAGAPMVVREKCWGDSYHEAATTKNCILRQEILYAGREGHVIHILLTKSLLERTVTIPLKNPSYKMLVTI